MRLLLVEDDEILGDGLVAGLKMEGYAVDWLTSGKLADEALKLNSYELIVLDLNLPDMDGMAILRALRSRKDETPVMVLTAKDTIPDRVMGLDSGADDFVIKPFELDEVCARLRALARRSEAEARRLWSIKVLSWILLPIKLPFMMKRWSYRKKNLRY